jgi:hypothetical protein
MVGVAVGVKVMLGGGNRLMIAPVTGIEPMKYADKPQRPSTPVRLDVLVTDAW